MTVNPARIGIIFGLFLMLVHAGWAALVAVGWAQALMDFVFWAHFITPPYRIEPFDTGRAATLLVLVLVAGMVMGVAGGAIWNLFAEQPGRD